MLLYNTNYDIASNLNTFFNQINLHLSKPHYKMFPHILLGLISSESVVTSDIAKNINHLNIQDESIQRKIRRLFNSKKFNPYEVYHTIITYVIDNYKVKHSDNRVHITFDHMFCSDNFTVLSFNLRIGKQSIPLWFRCFKGKSDPYAFSSSLIIEGINYVHNLFKDKNYNLIFLADRFFPSCAVLSHIASLNHTYVIRTKYEHKIRVFDNKEGHYVWKYIKDIKPHKYSSIIFNDVEYTYRHKILTNIVIGKENYSKDGIEEHWVIVTNGDPRRAIKDYAYRFGAIEFNFKNLKSNGFYLETTKTKNLEAFTALYTFASIAILWLTILGADYAKNKHNISYNFIKINDVKKCKNVYKRVLSLFNTGLTLFHKCHNSPFNFKLKCNFILYDY